MVDKAFHPLAWFAWLLASLTVAMVTRNPFYLALLVGVCIAVYRLCGQPGPMRSAWGVFLRVGLMMWLVATLLNLLTVHHGETVMFELPESLPIVGGPVTWEALIFGAVNGLALVAILVTFGVINAVLDFHKALKFVPHSLFEVGLVISIAIAFVPQTLFSLQEIREAQALRGHRSRGIRDLLPLFVPLLTTGLERSIQLAESMESRGFGSTADTARGFGSTADTARGFGSTTDAARGFRNTADTARSFGSTAVAGQHMMLWCKGGILAGLVGLLVGLAFYYYLPAWRPGGVGILAASALLLAMSLRGISRGTRRSRYRRQRWHARDVAVVAACALVFATFLILSLTQKASLAYYPYPRLTWPSFHGAIGGAILLLILPGAFNLMDGMRSEGR